MKNCILIALVILATATAKDVRLTCQTAELTECISGFKFRISGNGIDTKYCLPLGQTCQTSSDTTLKATKCDVDYKNDPCGPKVCFAAQQLSVCSADYDSCAVTGNSTLDEYDYQCKNCQTINNCAKCFVSFFNGAENSAEICLGSTCNTISNVSATVEPCSTD